MTTELDALPESVRSIVYDMDHYSRLVVGGKEWMSIRAELVRLTARVQELERENGELRADHIRLRWIAENGYGVRSRRNGHENACVWGGAVRGDEAVKALRYSVDRKRGALLPLDDEAKG